MSDHIRSLLRWLCAHDLPDQVVLCCPDQALSVPARSLGLRLDTCVRDTEIDLVAQVLAVGVRSIGVSPCHDHRDQVKETVGAWSARFPGQVRLLDDAPHRQRLRMYRGEVLDLACIPLPRRLLLGLTRGERPPLDLAADSSSWTLQALGLLKEQGRVRLTHHSAADSAALREETAPPVPAQVKAPALALEAGACTACGVCVHACPTSSLTLEVEGGHAVLLQSLESCRGSGSCVALCPQHVLVSRGTVDATDIMASPVRRLAALAVSVCTRCGSLHPSAQGDLCEVCSFRAEHQFGSALPPGLRL